MLHRVDAYKSARAPQTCLAMDRNSSGLLLRDPQELIDDGVWGCGAINKEEVCVVDSVACEFGFIVLGLVEADDVLHSEVLEDLNVIFRSVAPLRLTGQGVNRPHERDELVWNNPIKVTVLDFLVVLVLFVVELSENVPAETDSELQALEAVENSAFVSAGVSVAGVAEGPKLRVVRGKGFPNDLCRLFEHDHHKGTHQEARICLLVVLRARVVEKLDVLVPFVR